MKPVLNNYEITFQRAEKEFLKYDQEEMIRACGLQADDDYIYITFFYAPYRIHRKTGYAERQIAENTWRHCNYSEGMGIFDAICGPIPYRQLSGEMVGTEYFSKVGFSGRSMHSEYAERFSAEIETFQKVCLDLGAKPWGDSDAGFIFQLFDFLPMAIQLWEGEEGIPTAMRFMWDKNLLDFIYFETAMFITGHVLEELNAAMGFESIHSIATSYEE